MGLSLYARSEASPNRDSRVRLTSETDSLGQRKVHLGWKALSGDRERIHHGIGLLAREFGRQTSIRLQIPYDSERPWAGTWGGYHHLGTTRMHDDPKRGVTNADCRVHGTANLYIAGSSLFPTYGYANPTMTLVALALRLADHLETKV